MQPQSDSIVENGSEAEAMPASVPEPELPLPEPAPPGPPPGEILRKAREARGESLNDVAQILKLSAQQLEALENGRFNVLPGPTFVRGFLRNYARHLGIPPEPLLEGVSTRVPTTADLTSMLKLDGNVQPAARPRPQGKMFPVALIVLLALVLVGLVAVGIRLGWFDLRFEPPAAAPIHEKTVRLKQQTIEREILKPPVPVNIAPESANEPPLMERESGQVTALTEAEVSFTDTASAQTLPAAVPGAPKVPMLRLSFNGSTLAQVRDSSGKLIFTRTGAKGSSNSVKGKPPFSVVITQANNVTLEFKGQAVDLRKHTDKNGVARLTLQ